MLCASRTTPSSWGRPRPEGGEEGPTPGILKRTSTGTPWGRAESHVVTVRSWLPLFQRCVRAADRAVDAFQADRSGAEATPRHGAGQAGRDGCMLGGLHEGD